MRYLTLLLGLLVTIIGCSKNTPPLQPNPIRPLAHNSYIESLAEGVVAEETIIRGSVLTSDSCGNFYQSIILQDDSGTMELRFSFYDTYSLYHQFDVIAVVLTGKTIDTENGLKYVNIGSLALAAKSVFRQGYTAIIPPRDLAITELDSSHIGYLVRLSGGSFKNGGTSTWAGEQKYVVGKKSIGIYTSHYAKYANDLLPRGNVTITGIITMYKDKLQLKLSTPEDCIPE